MNPYSTIFFKRLTSKNNKLLNVSFVTKKRQKVLKNRRKKGRKKLSV